MTSFSVVYDAFLSKILEDEWQYWTQQQIKEDLFTLLQGALTCFKFPQHSLTYTETGFVDDLTEAEIQILATYMKCEWLNRTILTWENVKPLYEERDFSQANLLDKFNEMLHSERANARRLESTYYRSLDHKPYDYGQWATHVD